MCWPAVTTRRFETKKKAWTGKDKGAAVGKAATALNLRQQPFCEERLVDLNVARAYLCAGYLVSESVFRKPRVDEEFRDLYARARARGIVIGFDVNELTINRRKLVHP